VRPTCETPAEREERKQGRAGQRAIRAPRGFKLSAGDGRARREAAWVMMMVEGGGPVEVVWSPSRPAIAQQSVRA
jgi:hypothetical protein